MIHFNPISFCFDIVGEVHPGLDYQFHWGYIESEGLSPKEYDGPWGCTEFVDGEKASVVIDPRLPIDRFAEIFMHEVAHVAAGADADHGPKWQKEFDWLNRAYHQVYALKFGKVGDR